MKETAIMLAISTEELSSPMYLKKDSLPVLDDLIIMHSEISSCSTDSMNIMSRSLTMAPLITMISSPLMMPS